MHSSDIEQYNDKSELWLDIHYDIPYDNRYETYNHIAYKIEKLLKKLGWWNEGLRRA